MEWRRFVTYLWNDPRMLVLNFARSLKTPVQVCCFVLYLLGIPWYAKLTEMQILRTNFATVQTVQAADFIIKVIECPIPPSL